MKAHKHLGLVTVLIITIGIILSIQVSSGAAYHINPSSGSMDNDGSNGSPWSTLADVVAARKTFAGGDTLYLYSGYHGDITYVSGQNSTDVVIKAVEGQRPVLKRLYFGNASHWVLDGLVFSPYEADGSMSGEILVRMQAHFMTVRNCTFFSRWDESTLTAGDWISMVPEFAISVQGSCAHIANNTIRNVTFGVEVRKGCPNAVLEYNSVKNFSGDGFRVLSGNCLVQYNTVMDNYNVDSNHDDALQSYGTVSNVTVRGNLFVNLTDPTRDFKGDMHGIGCFDGPYDNWRIENNVIVVCTWNGISMLGVTNTTIINNTVLASETFMEDNKTEAAAWPAGVRTWIRISEGKNGSASTGNVVRNNLVNHIAIYDETMADIDHNVTGNNAADFVNDINGGDYMLKSGFQYLGMVAIDGGSDIGAPSVDIAGNPRPQGNAVDVGAYESPYSSSGGSAPVVIEGEEMTMAGYVIDTRTDGQVVMVNPSLGNPPVNGTATAAFAGPDGIYTLTMAIVPENDGCPVVEVYVNDRLVLTHTYPEDAGFFNPAGDREYVDLDGIEIRTGDEIKVVGTSAASTPTSPSQGGAWARFDKMVFTSSGALRITDLRQETGISSISAGVIMDLAGQVVDKNTAGTGMYLSVTDGQLQKIFIR